MKLEVGDKLVCVNVLDRLVYGETYTIVDTTIHYGEEDICIDVDGQWSLNSLWIGQIGSSEPWTNWFVLEKQWTRNKKLKELGL